MPVILPQGWTLIKKDETASTNADAKNLPSGSDRTAVVADAQTGGRGRLGRPWVSPAGNLYVSICLEKIPLARAGMYSFLTAVSLAEAMERLCPDIGVQCKWPNDLLVGGKKISGILLETDGTDRLVAGVGVNIVSFPETGMLYRATSLRNEGYAVTRDQMLESFLRSFARWDAELKSNGSARLLDAWKEKAYGIGGPVTVNLPNRKMRGTFYGLDKDGCLLLNKDGEIVKITAGDVFFGDQE